jgi:hypothetical protein
VKPLFPYFVGGQILLVLMAVVFRSRMGLVTATILPLLWVCLVEVQSTAPQVSKSSCTDPDVRRCMSSALDPS